MRKTLQRMAASLLRAKSQARRTGASAAKRALECDILEDRQLLSSMAMGHYGLNMSAHRGHARAGHAHAGLSRAPQGLPTSNLQAAGWLTSAPAVPAAPVAAPTTAVAATTTATPTTPAPTTPPAPTTTPAALTMSPTAPSTTTTPSAPSAQSQADFQKLQTDTQAIRVKSSVTVGQLATLEGDVQAIAKAAKNAPTQATITALQTDLTSLQGNLPTADQTTKLTADYTALVTSEGVTDTTLAPKVVSDVTAIMQASNVTGTDVSTIMADRKAIATDMGVTPTNLNAGLPFSLIFGGEGPGGPGFGGGMRAYGPGAGMSGDSGVGFPGGNGIRFAGGRNGFEGDSGNGFGGDQFFPSNGASAPGVAASSTTPGTTSSPSSGGWAPGNMHFMGGRFRG